MKKFLPWLALPLLLAALVYGQFANTMDQQLVQACYRDLMPEAASFKALSGSSAAALDASGDTLAYVGVSSYIGYGGPLLVGVRVNLDGTMSIPRIFAHKETPPYLHKIEQQGFFKQYESRRADDALTPGFDVDAVSGATLSSRAVALAARESAHAIAVQALALQPKKADLPWQAGVKELALAALFALSLMASRVKLLARCRLLLLGLSVGVLGFWLNRSFSLASVQAACMGFFPDIAHNLLWYIVLAGALLPALLLGKNLYCAFVCPFCGLQEITHKISHVDLPVGRLMKLLRPVRNVLLFAALMVGFISLNPSCASYEPFGTIFGLNGAGYSWYLLFIMLVASFFFHRFWCHLFCPAGAVLDFVAARRRDVAKLFQRKKSAPLLAPLNAPAKAGREGSAKGTAVEKARFTTSMALFLVFYLAGLGSIVWTVWENLHAN